MAITKQAILIGTGATVVAGGGYGVFYLSQDKTIRDRLTREGATLISSQEEYKVAFMENRGDKKLVTLLTNTNENSNATAGGPALEAWCNKNLNFDLSKKNIENVLPNVKKYCTKPSSTIEERITKLGKKLIGEEGWKDKAKELKAVRPEDTVLKSDLDAKNFENDNDNSKVGTALKKWCNDNIRKPLIEDMEDLIWKKVEGRCLQKD